MFAEQSYFLASDVSVKSSYISFVGNKLNAQKRPHNSMTYKASALPGSKPCCNLLWIWHLVFIGEK